MKNIVQRKYTSTYDFVQTNKLEEEANKLFGKNWEAEDDVSQIEYLLEFIGADFFTVVYIEDAKTNHDIEVLFNDDLKRISDLEYALKELCKNIDLSKLKIRKDFSLINAHAYATKLLN